MFISTLFAILMLSLATGAILYLYILGGYGIIAFHKKKRAEYCFDKTFIVLIPAHNEELSVATAIRSIQKNDYPPERYEIIVIADNCTDATASLAGELGVMVWERHDADHKGKGYALDWAIGRIDPGSVDIIAIIDADNLVEPNFFKTVAGIINRGNEVVQTFFGFFEVEKSPYAYLQYLSNLTENHLFHNPRALLRLPGHLIGSGMVFKASIFSEVPWSSHSITEDSDYSMDLLVHAKKATYTAMTKVYQKPTRTFRQAFGQRVRGSSGVIQAIGKYFFKLIGLGFKRNDPSLFEFALSLLMLSRPSLIYLCFFAVILGIFGSCPILTSLWGIIAVIMLVIYLFLGIFLSPVKGPIIRAVLLSPVFGLWLLLIQLLSLFGFHKNEWSRTGRVEDD